MKYFLLSMIISTYAFAGNEPSLAEKLGGLLKSANSSLSAYINAKTKDYKITKIYTANSFEMNTVNDISAQTVLLEVWDFKNKSQVLLISPQGANEFFEIKNLYYIRSNATSELQHVSGYVYAEENGTIKKIQLSMFKSADSLNLSLGNSESRMHMDRLVPATEKLLIEHVSGQLTRDAWTGLKIERGYKINDHYYFELPSGTLESKLLVLVKGKLVESSLTVLRTPYFITEFFENGKKLFTLNREAKSDRTDYVAEKLNSEDMAKVLDFKTFEFKTLIETRVAEKNFSPEYYIKTGTGRDLFVNIKKLKGVTRESIMSAMYRDVEVNAVAEVAAAVLDSVIEATYKAKLEYSSNGIFLTIYGKDSNDILQLDISYSRNPKIVRNDWKVKLVGRTFDANFSQVADSYTKINNKMGPKILSCKKLIGLL